MNKVRKMVAPILDFSILVMVVIASIMLIGNPAAGGLDQFKYFTVQSNLLMGTAATVSFIFEILLLTNKIQRFPLPLRIIELSASIGTTVTFFTVIFFHGPTRGWTYMYLGGNLFMHMLVPLLAMIRVAAFQPQGNIMKLKHTFFGIVHLGVYSVAYLVNCAIHNGYGTTQYDWYGFGAGGFGAGILSLVIMVAVGYVFSLLFYFLQNKFCSSPEAIKE